MVCKVPKENYDFRKERIKMIRLIALIISSVIVISGASAAAYGAEYTDVKPAHWAYEAVNAMSEQSVIAGYPDGSFLPNQTVTYGEFIKMALIAATGEDEGNAASGHWAQNYYDKALELGYFTEYDIERSMLGEKITRAHMALIISSILGDIKIKNYDEIQEGITDITYKTPYEYDITKSYAAGILTGYEDKTFRPNKTLSRAEAATVIYRLVDESKRILPDSGKSSESSNNTTRPLEEVITNYKNVYSHNGFHDKLIANAKTYEFVNDGTQYGFTIHENQGTTWIEIPAFAAEKLGRLYSMKDGKIVEGLKQYARIEGGAAAVYYYDITKVDYIVSLDINDHLLIISNPFKQ